MELLKLSSYFFEEVHIFCSHGKSGRAQAGKINVSALQHFDGKALPTLKNCYHKFQVRIGKGDDAPALSRPQIDCVFEDVFREWIASHKNAKSSKLIFEVAVQLIDVFTFNLADVFKFENKLTTVVKVKDIS